MTAAVLPYQSSLSFPMSLYGNDDRSGGYYQPSSLSQTSLPQSYLEQKQQSDYLVPTTPVRERGTFLHPKNSLPPLQSASNYSSPTVLVPPSSHQRHQYGPISNSALQSIPNHSAYLEHGTSTTYSNAPYPSAAYSIAGSPDQVSSSQMLRIPSYHQASPTSAVPSPHSAAGRHSFYGYTSYAQQPNYIHSAGAVQYSDSRASFSYPHSAGPTAAYSKFSQPSTPISARDTSNLYSPWYTSSTAQVSTPRQAALPSYHSASSSVSKTSPLTGSISHSSTAAPGPIPATTPLIVKDEHGVQWITFMYSKDKHKREYKIRCDTESVDIKALSASFKEANTVYPRAQNRAEYTGNRWQYESECNHIGWALAHLNPELRDNRGATQRAVDSWRNTSKDVKIRSRRVKRQNKAVSRAKAQQQMQMQTTSGMRGSVSALEMQRPLPETASGTHQHHLPTTSVDDSTAVRPTTSTSTSTPLHPLPPTPTSTSLLSPIDSRYTTGNSYTPHKSEYDSYTSYGPYIPNTGNTTYSMMPPPLPLPSLGASLYSRDGLEYADRHQ